MKHQTLVLTERHPARAEASERGETPEQALRRIVAAWLARELGK